MSLHNKLQLWLSTIFLVIITSVFGLIFHYSHSYLADQQKIQIMNTISALNIALVPFVEKKDKVGMESVINASFDSGFYGSISLKMNDNSFKIERKGLDSEADVPVWFQKLAPFESLKESRVLMDGWLQVAELNVTSNTKNSYEQLWMLFVRLFMAFIIILFIAAFSLALLIRLILKPLKLIQKRANEISLYQFGEPLPPVDTKELSDVVEAINYMSKHVENYYIQSADEVKKLHIKAFQDPVSGLNNRAFFITQLEPWVKLDSHDHCIVWLVSIEAIESLYKSKQFEKADQMVKAISTQLSQLIENKATLARFSQSEFTLIFPNGRYEQLEHLAKSTLNIIDQLSDDPASHQTAAIGMVVVNNQPDMTTIFTQLDNALTEARNQASPKVYLYNEEAILPEYTKGKIEWQNLVEHAINNQLVKIKMLPALDNQNNIIHYEAQPYLEIDNIIYTVNRFITALDGSNVANLFDVHTLMLIKTYILQNQLQAPVAINITRNSINNNQFISFIEQAMFNYQNLSQSLLLGLPEISFIRNPDEVKKIIELCNRYNFKYGIRDFGYNFNSIDYLQEVHPQYVQLDFAYTSQLTDPVKSNMLSSIVRLANNFNVLTIATHVESEQQRDELEKLGVSGFQGNLIES